MLLLNSMDDLQRNCIILENRSGGQRIDIEGDLIELQEVAVIAEECIFLAVNRNGAEQLVVLARPVHGTRNVQGRVGCPDRKIRINRNQRDSGCSQFHSKNLHFLL